MKKIMQVRGYVDLGPLEVSSYLWQRIKSIFTIIERVGNTGILFYITVHSSFVVLVCIVKVLIFYSGAQGATQYLLFPVIENS